MARASENCHFNVAKCPYINSELLILHSRGAILTYSAAYLFLIPIFYHLCILIMMSFIFGFSAYSTILKVVTKCIRIGTSSIS